MYVVVNIQNHANVLRLVELLFKNGFPSVGVCDSLKDACPRCNATDETATTSMKGTYAQHVSPNSGMQSRKRKPANRSISPPRLKIAAQTRSSTRLNVSGASNGLTDVKNDKNNHIVTVERVVDDDDGELVEDVPHTSADYNSSVFDEDETQDFEEDHELDVKPDPAKMIWKDSQNRDTLQCQICARRVLRNEHTGNVNHLSRHSRTHASTKQFSCSICGSTTTRRYMAINHVKVLHPSVESPHTHIVDHGKELRTEYIGLLDKCFPGIRGHRTGIRMYRDDSNEPSEHGDDVEEVPNSES